MSAESDLLLLNLQYLRDDIAAGRIDVGAMVVASNNLANFLAKGVADFGAAVKAVDHAGASYLPLVVLALDHDGPGGDFLNDYRVKKAGSFVSTGKRS